MAADSQQRRALIVEDERPIRELVRLHLELGGFAVVEVGDGNTALDLARTSAVDLRPGGGANGAAERDAIKARKHDVEQTRQEFDLLHKLASRPGIVYSRAALLHSAWNEDSFVTERTVDTVISRLRRKIECDAQDPELILTAWGVGYKFVDVGRSS